MRRPLFAVLAASLLSPLAFGSTLAAPTSHAKIGLDRAKNVSFSINGTAFQVTLNAYGETANPLTSELSNQGVALACKGRDTRRHRWIVSSIETAWPKGQAFLRGTFPQDVSLRTQWCVLEQPDGKDLALTRKLHTPKPDETAGDADGGVIATTP